MEFVQGHSIFLSPPRPPLEQSLSEKNFFEGTAKILKRLDENFKGANNKKQGCRNLPSIEGLGGGGVAVGVDKNRNVPLSYAFP